jgi:hypothetical protein
MAPAGSDPTASHAARARAARSSRRGSVPRVAITTWVASRATASLSP